MSLSIGPPSIKAKAALVATGGVLLLFAAFAIFHTHRLRVEMRAALGQQQLALISQIAFELDGKITLAHQALAATASAVPREMMQESASMEGWMYRQPGLRSLFDDLLLIGRDGRVRVDVPALNRRGIDVHDRGYFRRTIESRAPVISEPYMGRGRPEPTVMMTAPLLGRDGEMQGMLAGAIHPSDRNFLGRLREARVGETGRFALVSLDGTIIVSPFPERALTKGPKQGTSLFFDHAMTGHEGWQEAEGLFGGPQALHSYKPLESVPWVLIASLPVAEAYAPIDAAQKEAAVVGLALMLLLAPLVWLGMQRVLFPVQVLRDAIRRFRKDPTSDAIVRMPHRDEMGDLAEDFNSMVRELRGVTDSLRASEERYRHLAELSSDWYWEQDAELRFVSTSGRNAGRGGIAAEDHPRRRRWELPGTEIVGQSWEEHKAVLKARQPFRDLILKRSGANGETHFISVSGEPVFDQAGEFTGYRGIARDITERVAAEQQARDANDRLRLAVEQLNEAVAVTDANDVIVVANKQFRELNANTHLVSPGRRYEEHLREGMAIGNFPESSGREEEWLAARLERRRFGGTFEIRRQDGKWLQVTDQRLPDGGTITFSLDITERKRVEDELRANQRLLEQVIDAIPMSIFAKDLDSNYVMVNRYMAEFFGTTKSALVLRHTLDLPSRDATREQSLRDDRQVFQTREPLVHETWIERPDGTPVPYHSSKIPLFDESGALTGLLGINRDISEQRQAQEQLRASEQLFAAMFHDSPGPLAVVDPSNRRFQEVNRAFTDLFGYSRDQVVGRTSAEFGAATETDERSELYDTLARDGFVHRMTLHSIAADATTNVSLVSGRVIEIGARRIVLFSFSDITELSEAQRRIEEINATLEDRVRDRTAQLESANRELEAFSYSVSHDLKAPLRSIDGAAGILKEKYGGQLPAGAEPYLARISQRARQMGALIEGLLEFARLSRQILNLQRVEPDAIVRQVLRDHDEAMRDRSVELTLHALPPCNADPLLLRQVFANLVANAFKFSSHATPPRIDIGAEPSENGTVYYVRDNGVGFDMAYADKLFGVFQRLHGADQFEGTGIGLALVSRIVERHGGRIWADSRLGNGATFFFTLDQNEKG